MLTTWPTAAQLVEMPEHRRNLYLRLMPDPPALDPGEIALVEFRKALPIRRSVYFIGTADGPIKIGVATDPVKRLATLQTGNHERLHILATVPGAAHAESMYHYRFREHRLHGEWFQRHPDILAEIERLA